MTFDAEGNPLEATAAEWDAWFELHPEPERTEDEWTALENSLPLELVPEFNRLKDGKFSEWPEGLYEHVRAYTTRVGVCGETMICGIADWLRKRG
jgi:hypothetical protein